MKFRFIDHSDEGYRYEYRFGSGDPPSEGIPGCPASFTSHEHVSNQYHNELETLLTLRDSDVAPSLLGYQCHRDCLCAFSPCDVSLPDKCRPSISCGLTSSFLAVRRGSCCKRRLGPLGHTDGYWPTARSGLLASVAGGCGFEDFPVMRRAAYSLPDSPQPNQPAEADGQKRRGFKLGTVQT